MADYNWLDNDDDDDVDTSRPSNSDALREARQAAKRNAKAAKAAGDELLALRAELHERRIADAIRDKGLNPKIARLAKDVPAEELAAFLDDFADVFGVGSVQTSEDLAVTPPDQNLVTLQRISSGQSQQPSSLSPGASLEQQIAGASTAEELNLVLFGNRNGPAAY